MATSKIERPLIKTATYTMTNTISGSSASAFSKLASEISISGYKPIGVIQVRKSGSGHTAVLIYQFGIVESSGDLVVGLQNTATSERTVTVDAVVIYQRS